MFPVRQKIRSKLLPILALAVSLPVVAQQADSAQPEPDAATTLHHIKTVFIIVMENHNWTGNGSLDIKGNPGRSLHQLHPSAHGFLCQQLQQPAGEPPQPAELPLA